MFSEQYSNIINTQTNDNPNEHIANRITEITS